jgi:hypothetical protein
MADKNKMSLVADVYSPQAVKTMKFTGDHPSRVLKIVPSLMKSVFRLSGSKFYEDELKWDKTTEIIDFYCQWRGAVDMDGRTKFWVKVKVIGDQTSKEKKGSVTIYIQPYIKTDMPYDSAMEKILTAFYSRLFYKKTVRSYIAREILYLRQFEELVKKELGMK